MADCAPPPNIYLVGAQSTGKTTLVNALSAYFATAAATADPKTAYPHIVTETARTVLQKHNFSSIDITSSTTRAFALQKLILEAQVVAERAVSSESKNDGADGGAWFISDRSGADPIMYAKKHASDEAAEELLASPNGQECIMRMRKGLVIICEPGTAEWLVNDGVRLMPGSRDEWIGFHELFSRCLMEWGVEFTILPCEMKDLGQRVEYVVGRWKDMIGQGE